MRGGMTASLRQSLHTIVRRIKRRPPLSEWGRARLPDRRRHRRLSARVSVAASRRLGLSAFAFRLRRDKSRNWTPALSSVPRLLLLYQSPRVKKPSGNLARATQRHWFKRKMPMTLVLVMAFNISVALALGFVFGRIYQIRSDELGRRVEPPPVARTPQP
jgi:hypothetical protein